jgi:hypothetical protein
MKRFAIPRLKWSAEAGTSLFAQGQFPTPPFQQSRRWWYQWFMTTDRGAEAVRADPLGFARIQWETWSPSVLGTKPLKSLTRMRVRF